MSSSTTSNRLVLLVIVVMIGILAYSFLTMPDRRNGLEKVGDAIHELPQGPDKAARQLESRTPGEKIGDAVKDAGDGIKQNTSQP